mmetsp:Transcript_68696/g.114168  ORF Transcript_68696/g.114168 Transcript_68696/m.114168 type:complete len:238 (-) Transcript_68696:904-1617(-)
MNLHSCWTWCSCDAAMIDAIIELGVNVTKHTFVIAVTNCFHCVRHLREAEKPIAGCINGREDCGLVCCLLIPPVRVRKSRARPSVKANRAFPQAPTELLIISHSAASRVSEATAYQPMVQIPLIFIIRLLLALQIRTATDRRLLGAPLLLHVRCWLRSKIALPVLFDMNCAALEEGRPTVVQHTCTVPVAIGNGFARRSPQAFVVAIIAGLAVPSPACNTIRDENAAFRFREAASTM